MKCDSSQSYDVWRASVGRLFAAASHYKEAKFSSTCTDKIKLACLHCSSGCNARQKLCGGISEQDNPTRSANSCKFLKKRKGILGDDEICASVAQWKPGDIATNQ